MENGEGLRSDEAIAKEQEMIDKVIKITVRQTLAHAKALIAIMDGDSLAVTVITKEVREALKRGMT